MIAAVAPERDDAWAIVARSSSDASLLKFLDCFVLLAMTGVER